MLNFIGRNVLITGASGAIGTAITKLLHSLGAYLYISGRNEKKLITLKDELGSNCTIKLCDLSDPVQCTNLINSIENIDVLICNAGMTHDALAIKMKNDEFARVIDVNLNSSFILNRESIKKMIRNRYGRIINITSVVAISGNPGQVNYCASKAGLIGMTKSLAYETASRSITVNAIAPGFITSEMTDKLSDQQKDLILQKIPLKTYGKPTDVANCVAFLASAEASYITGQTLHVNGGMLMV